MFFWHIDFRLTNHDFHLGTFYTGHTQLIIHNVLLTGTVEHRFLVRVFHAVEGSHVFKKLKEFSVQSLFISKLICRSRKRESCGHDMDKTRAAHISLNSSSTKLVLDMTKWLKPFCSCNWMFRANKVDYMSTDAPCIVGLSATMWLTTKDFNHHLWCFSVEELPETQMHIYFYQRNSVRKWSKCMEYAV